MRKSVFLTLLIFSVISQKSYTQPLSLTLDESISLSLKQGYAVQNVTSQYLISKKNYTSALRKLRSSIDLDFELPNYRESLSNQFNTQSQTYQFYQTQTLQMQTSLTISQPVVFTGGTLTFRDYVFRRDQTSGLSGLQTTSRDFFSNFAVEYRQPLFTANQLRINAIKAELGLEQVETEFLKDQLDVVYSVTESFYSVYQLSQRLEIVKEQVSQNKDSYETAQGKFQAGLIPEVEALQSDVDLVTSQNDLLNTQRELERAKNSFRILLGMNLQQVFMVETNLQFISVQVDTILAIENALHSRSEVLNSERNKQLREMDIDVAESKRDFRIDLTASYGLNRNDAALQNVFQNFGTSRNAALTISVPLFDWGSNGLEVEAAEIQYRNTLLGHENVQQQIRQEVIDLISRLRLAESRIRVLEKVVAVAQKGYDINLERFKSGSIGRNDLAQAQTRLTSAKLNNLSALIDYKLAVADLSRKTMWNFEKNELVKPVIETER